MKKIIIISIFFFILACSKPKTVFICGDHTCVNKTEAKQFFEENLTLEVKIVNNKKHDQFDLVELNLNSTQNEKKKINIHSKDKTKKKLKILSNKEKKRN